MSRARFDSAALLARLTDEPSPAPRPPRPAHVVYGGAHLWKATTLTRAREIASRPAAARYRQRIDALLRAADVSDRARAAGAKANAVHIESAEVNR